MNINWVSVKREHAMRSDVSIHFTTGGDVAIISFSSGTMGVKFGHKKKIALGFDENCSRMYFLPNDTEGYTVHATSGGKGSIQVQTKRIDGYLSGKVRTSSLLGDYQIRRDDEAKAWFISIGALTR